MKQKNNIIGKAQNEKGIGLIELVVAVGIFSTVVITATGIFMNAVKAQKAVLAKQNVADSARYAMEYMAKELRMAKINATPDMTFNDGTNPIKNSSFSAITFLNSSSNSITYSLSADKIQRNGQAISSEEVLITGLVFTINNWDLTIGSSGTAPLITILIKAKAKSGVGGEMELQTTVSPRIY